MVLIELPPMYSAMNAVSADSGIDRKTPAVARALPEEHQHHQRRQQQSDAAFAQQRFDRPFDEERLIEHDLGHELLTGRRRAG